MRIAIIGSGISGLVAAHRLQREHDIVVYEANDYIGGHTNTVDVAIGGRQLSVDTGFIVFNDRTYPNFCRLMDELGVVSDPTSMSFSVRCSSTGLEYNGTSLNGVFAQRRNLLRPGFHRMIRDILRFNREAPSVLGQLGDDTTVGEFLQQHEYSKRFADHYLLPMGAAIWSCPTATFEQFPIRFIIEFYHNHGLLSLRDRPTWRVIRGGSRNYVDVLTRPFLDRIRLNAPVSGVARFDDGVKVQTSDGELDTFDEVIFACHSDQALRILDEDSTGTERDVLSAIPYEANTAVLHTDTALLPKHRRAWASWNYHIPVGKTNHATLTYNMNILQHIDSQETLCVTLNEDAAIAPDKVLATFRYCHPVFTTQRSAAQTRHGELIRSNRTSFCGAYWGNGFHEDGVNSALAVADSFDMHVTSASESLSHA